MAEILLDSDILIDPLRGYEPARQYLKRFEAGEMQEYLSIITVATCQHPIRFPSEQFPPWWVKNLSSLPITS